jgi:broad specificity phosphatase PhoE
MEFEAYEGEGDVDILIVSHGGFLSSMLGYDRKSLFEFRSRIPTNSISSRPNIPQRPMEILQVRLRKEHQRRSMEV